MYDKDGRNVETDTRNFSITRQCENNNRKLQKDGWNDFHK